MSVGFSICQAQAASLVLGRVILIHPAAVGPFQLASTLAAKTQYGQRVIAQAHDGVLTPQGYNCRPISGSGGAVTEDDHSEHAHNIAVDVSPVENPMSDTGVWRCAMALYGIADGTAFVMAWHAAGFRWGGIWDKAPTLAGQTPALVSARLAAKQGVDLYPGDADPPRLDPMHFELELTPQQVAAIDWAQLIAEAKEDDDVTDADIDKIVAGVATAVAAALKPVTDFVLAVDEQLKGLVRGIDDGPQHLAGPSAALEEGGLGDFEKVGWHLGAEAQKAINALPTAPPEPPSQ